MCNPYLMAPRDQVERCFRAIAPQDKCSTMPLKPDQWRLCFVWTNVGATDVEIVDYH